MSRTSAALLFAIAVALTAGWTFASADESIELPEPVDPSVVVLEPGKNLVGWVGASRSAAWLTRQAPNIESIQEWDAQAQQLVDAESLEAGKGYAITLDGEASVSFRRPMTPVLGKIELKRGRNLVTWLGAADWSIDRVALGIGRTLTRVEWRDASYHPGEDADTASLPPVQRGDALWVTVSRAVNWLQPSGILPTVKFAGPVSATVRKWVQRDNRDVMNHFAEQFGLQPDGANLTVYIAADPESLIEVLETDGFSSSGVHGTWYKAGGWASPLGYVVVKTEYWGADYQHYQCVQYDVCANGRGILAHELFHSIQQQLSSTSDAVWLHEGSAEWAKAGLWLLDAGSSFEDALVHDRNHARTEGAPPLAHTEHRLEVRWNYSLGALASHQLALRAGEQSLLEFYRAMLPEPLGPLGRWQTSPPWQSTFRSVFGFTVEEFYGEFAEWRGGLSAGFVKGRVIGPKGGGLPYVRVRGRSERLSEEVGYDYTTTHTDADGNFALPTSELGVVSIGVDLGGCEAYYSENGTVYRWRDAATIDTTVGVLQPLLLEVSEQTCVWQVSGKVFDRGGLLPSGNWISVAGEGANGGAHMEHDGSFAITLPTAGTYRLSVYVDGCTYYYNRERQGGSWSQATQITIADSDVNDIEFVIPEGACSAGIRGNLLDSDGEPIADVWLSAHTERGYAAGDHTGADGSFEISIAEHGRYYIQARINGCPTYYRRGGATHDQARATWLAVEDSVEQVSFRLPRGLCSTTISGRVLDTAGVPIANATVEARDDDLWARSEVDTDGRFTITLPKSGQYRLRAEIDSCHVYYRRSGVSGSRNQATEIRVANEDVKDITIQLAEGVCKYRIVGKILHANGTGKADAWVSVSGSAGSGGVRSNSDGTFSITVPVSGSYRLSAHIDGCWIYRGSRGPTKNWNSASQVRVSNADVTGVEFRLPENPSTFCN